MPDLISFIKEVFASPILLAAVGPAIAMMLVNGWTDAPVAIATAVRSGAIKMKPAAILAAVCNFLGAAAMMLFGNPVAVSVYSIAGLGRLSGDSAGSTLTAAMLSVVIWSLFALYCGIPTSESHALLAGLTGAAVARVGLSAFNKAEWLKVLFGLFISTVPVLYAAAALSRFLDRRLGRSRRSEAVFGKLQIAGAAVSSFAHGAQDGQKFAGVMTLAAAVCLKNDGSDVSVPLWTAAFSAGVISLGMLLGGRRIIKSFDSFASQKSSDGFAADVTAAAALVAMSFFGIPASTTHAKTVAVLGASVPRHKRLSGGGAVLKMTFFWVLTFPVCAALGYLLSHILFFMA